MSLFKRILNLISLTKNTQTQMLGRWKLESCEKRVNAKANWANEDHCGACGDSALKKQADSVPSKP